MGQFLITYPDIRETDLVFDTTETKQILTFFYPSHANRINSFDINNDARKLAQTMLIAAIDASHTMSFLDVLTNSLSGKPRMSVAKWARKLSGALTRKWFKNATQKDLLTAEIYYTVRVSIASACAQHFRGILDGVAFHGRIFRSYAVA